MDGELAQVAKCLPQKHKDLSMTPRTHVEIPGMVVCACNPSGAEIEAGGSLGLTGSQSNLIAKLQANKMPCLRGGRWYHF